MKRLMLTALCVALSSTVWAGSHKIMGLTEPAKWNRSMAGDHMMEGHHGQTLPIWLMREDMMSELRASHSLPSLPVEPTAPPLAPMPPKVMQTAQVELVDLPVYIISVNSIQVDGGSHIRLHNGNMRYKFDIATKEVWASVMNGTSMAWRPVRMDSPGAKAAMNQIFREATGRQFI